MQTGHVKPEVDIMIHLMASESQKVCDNVTKTNCLNPLFSWRFSAKTALGGKNTPPLPGQGLTLNSARKMYQTMSDCFHAERDLVAH